MKYSNIINPLTLLRSKIPLFILTVQMSVTNIAFTPCPNSITPFLVYFSIISILCLLYEGFHSYINYNQIEDKLKKWVMVISSTLISYLSFFAVSVETASKIG